MKERHREGESNRTLFIQYLTLGNMSLVEDERDLISNASNSSLLSLFLFSALAVHWDWPILPRRSVLCNPLLTRLLTPLLRFNQWRGGGIPPATISQSFNQSLFFSLYVCLFFQFYLKDLSQSASCPPIFFIFKQRASCLLDAC